MVLPTMLIPLISGGIAAGSSIFRGVRDARQQKKDQEEEEARQSSMWQGDGDMRQYDMGVVSDEAMSMGMDVPGAMGAANPQVDPFELLRRRIPGR